MNRYPKTGRKRLFITVKNFVRAKSLSGIILFFSALSAVFMANSIYEELYNFIIHSPIILTVNDIVIQTSAKHIINDILMTIFFLLTGLEIKREMLYGQLVSLKAALFPIIGAIGGMIVPSIIYISFNYDSGYIQGFGVPMATDIAFALGILLLLGNRIALELKLFLITLAIVDDIGSVIIIAIFYSEPASLNIYLLILFTLSILFILNKQRINSLIPYIIIAMILWYLLHHAGIHASITGVILAFFIPGSSHITPLSFIKRIRFRLNYFENLENNKITPDFDTKQLNILDVIGHSYKNVQSPMLRLEHMLIPLSSFVVLPLFAFFNAGVNFSTESFSFLHPVTLGIVFGLLIGKPLGIFGSVYIAHKLHIAAKPLTLRWLDIALISVLGGIGFTMSIFIGEIAFFDNIQIISIAKIAVLLSSLIAGMIGCILLLIFVKRN
jgi:NhaA family Na+:H+ antiporter